MKKPLNIALFVIAWISCALGLTGVFIPVLPTTPLLLLATFLFAKTSPKAHAWITSTKTYRMYVVAFQDAGGMSLSAKVRMIALSYTVLGISAWLVRIPLVWFVLAVVAVFLLYLVALRIPTISREEWMHRCEMEFAE